ncbi:YceD family protein [Croceicoccus bisphenolivorans]|uniref:YceD family protein n=1 Tax=Croceicoccus bisphenolivorans TaxID=1783232 RepID=UPI0008367BCE|nr:DUF177 domain-containing protein [Croceicoccus bisphenolivorans]
MTHELSELSRWVAVRQSEGREIEVIADAAERERLAERFDLVRVDSLEAKVLIGKDGAAITANGRLTASFVQSCAVSGEDLPAEIDEPLALRFVPGTVEAAPDEEIELEAGDCDEIYFEGDRFDIGEAVAQSLALAIDPFATGPEAERIRREVGLAEPQKENPFAALKGLQ